MLGSGRLPFDIASAYESSYFSVSHVLACYVAIRLQFYCRPKQEART
jgi:hypothetical protein